MIDGQNLLDQLAKNDLITYDNVREIRIGQGNDYTTDCVLDYSYFKENYKLIAIDLSKQKGLKDLMLIQKQYNKINFTETPARNSITDTTMIFITEEAKETILDFWKETVNVL